MNLVLLSGGSGKRLWPLSNDVRSKQFIKIFDDGHGGKESMIQRMYRGARKVDLASDITVATSKSQISELKNQIGDDVSISVEPSRRDTFPAIVLAVSYLHDVKKIPLDQAVVICPVDPYVEDDFFEALNRLSFIAEASSSNITLMGIEPTYPSEKYGYIIPKSTSEVSDVLSFKEKPDESIASGLISKGGLWNAGVFAFKIRYLLDKAHTLIDFKDYNDLFKNYDNITKISFDFAVLEKETSIQVLRFKGKWADLGTWNTLAESMSGESLGKVVMGERCEGNHVFNYLDVPILCVGIKDLIVAASPEGVLVTDKLGSSKIKPYVDKLEGPIMFAEKSWGEYKVIDFGPDSLTIRVTLTCGHHMSYHSHQRRDETWTVVSGNGTVKIDGETKKVTSGSLVFIKAGTKHSISATTDLVLIEVQIGKDIDVKDKIKYEH